MIDDNTDWMKAEEAQNARDKKRVSLLCFVDSLKRHTERKEDIFSACMEETNKARNELIRAETWLQNKARDLLMAEDALQRGQKNLEEAQAELDVFTKENET